jgi:hypothetical protein
MIVKQIVCDRCGKPIETAQFRVTFMHGKGKHKQFDYDKDCWEAVMRQLSEESKIALNKAAKFQGQKD